MAEPSTGGSSPQPPKELSTEVRLLLAFLLMGAVMFFTPYLFKTAAPPPGKKSPETAGAPATSGVPGASGKPAPAETAPLSGASAEPAAPEGPPTSEATAAQPSPPFTIDTDLFRVTFSNQGATVRSWLLKKYTKELPPKDYSPKKTISTN